MLEVEMPSQGLIYEMWAGQNLHMFIINENVSGSKSFVARNQILPWYL